MTDALQKLDSIYGVIFEGKTYDIGNRLEWVKISIEFALDDSEFKNDLVGSWKATSRYENDMPILKGRVN